MSTFSLAHLSDGTLARDLAALVARDRITTAALLAHIAEFDARKLYLTAGQPSMYMYCMRKLGFCEQAAYKRIRAARSARRFPAIFAAVADGRLHLSAVVLLAPYVTTENATELLAAAAHQSRAQVETLLAHRFPRPDLPTMVQAIPAAPSPGSAPPAMPPSPEPGKKLPGDPVIELSPGTVDVPPGTWVEPPAPRPRVTPLAPERFALQMTIGQETHRKLQHAQTLLGSRLTSGDLAGLLDRALDALIDRLEKQKFAAVRQPRPGQSGRNGQRSGERQAPAGRRRHPDSRHVPAEVRRAVWQRDGGRCTFVGDDGTRCPARSRLEFDHVDAYGTGGSATVSGIRLLCRAHNQHEAERTYGAEFMRHKRLAAAERRAETATQRAAAEKQAQAEPRASRPALAEPEAYTSAGTSCPA